MSLADRLTKALQRTRHVASNPYFSLFVEEAARIDRQAAALPWMSDALGKLVSLADDSKQLESVLLDGNQSTELFQKLGELHVATVLAERHVLVTKIPEQSQSTPDFSIDHGGHRLYLEVKTLSFVDGGRAIDGTLYGSVQPHFIPRSATGASLAGRTTSYAEVASCGLARCRGGRSKAAVHLTGRLGSSTSTM
jgi:hypothetical protein